MKITFTYSLFLLSVLCSQLTQASVVLMSPENSYDVKVYRRLEAAFESASYAIKEKDFAGDWRVQTFAYLRIDDQERGHVGMIDFNPTRRSKHFFDMSVIYGTRGGSEYTSNPTDVFVRFELDPQLYIESSDIVGQELHYSSRLQQGESLRTWETICRAPTKKQLVCRTIATHGDRVTEYRAFNRN